MPYFKKEDRKQQTEVATTLLILWQKCLG